MDAAAPSEFLSAGAAEVDYGNILDEVPRERAAAGSDGGGGGGGGGQAGGEGGKVPNFPDRPPKKDETTRQKNSRKEKLGQATFSLKWDRDCGAEKAPQGLAAAGKGKGGGGGGGKGKGGEDALTMKERTKNKRKLDQSASFLGGRWKTEEEMHMRDHFDS